MIGVKLRNFTTIQGLPNFSGTMKKEEIIAELEAKHRSFIASLTPLNSINLEKSEKDKWSPLQHLKHIILSVKPLAQGISFAPKLLIKAKYGTRKETSKSYSELVQAYQDKLAEGGKAPSNFVPESIVADQLIKLQTELTEHIQSITNGLKKSYSEHDLDKMQLPHPLLGKISVREMMYFTIYHVQHHQKSIQYELNS